MEPTGLAFSEPEDRLRDIRKGAVPHFASAFALRASADSLARNPP